jgi:hypothetical protein
MQSLNKAADDLRAQEVNPIVQAIYDSLISTEAKQLISAGFRLMAQYVTEPENLPTWMAEFLPGGQFDIQKILSGFTGDLMGSGGILTAFLGGSNAEGQNGGIMGMFTQVLTGLTGKIDKEKLTSQITGLADNFDFSGLSTELTTKMEGAMGGIEQAFQNFSLEDKEYDLLAKDDSGAYISDNWAVQMDAITTASMEQIGKNSGEAFMRGLTGTIQNATTAMQPFMDESSEIKYSLVPVVIDGEGFDFANNGSLTVSGTVSIDTLSISSIATSISTEMAKTTAAAVTVLTNHIDSLDSAIRSMRIVLNTGVLAGAIDKELGAAAGASIRTTIVSGP